MARSAWIDRSGNPATPDTIKSLVFRVMKDGQMDKFEACKFVATMFPGTIGLQVLNVVDS